MNIDVRRKLKDAGFTQASFARFVCVHPNTINRWCRDRRMPHWALMLLRERKVLGRRVHEGLQLDGPVAKKLKKTRRRMPWRLNGT